MPKYQSGLHKIKVNTWGTNDHTSNGLANFAKGELFGGNVGHASIEMILPINTETNKWIETYCMEESFEEYKKTLPSDVQEKLTFNQYLKLVPKRIPVRLVEHSTPLAQYNNDDKLEKTNKIASKTSYYKIDFSFWPGNNLPFYLSSIEEDRMLEREGHHFEYSDRAKNYFQPEERIHKGTLGSQKMTYAPSSIAHQRDLGEQNFSEIELALKLAKIRESLNTSELLFHKINKLKSPKLNGSLSLLCKNIGLPIDTILEEFNKKKSVKNHKIDIDQFTTFFKNKADEHFSKLRQLENDLKKYIPNISRVLKKDHVTLGIPPDHTIELPFITESNRGFNPEEMLKKMRELIEPYEDEFDLYSKNCSKTSTAVLRAGAAHDPLLMRTVGEEALGFIGTPQQVIGNAKRANYIIETNQNSNPFIRIANTIIAMFKSISNWLSNEKQRVDFENHITTPLPSKKEDTHQNASSYNLMAKLVDKQVARNINEKTLSISKKKGSALELLDLFEHDLNENPDKLVTLSAKNFDIINQYVRKKNDPDLSARFQSCCDESLSRANQLSPLRPSDVDEVVEQISSGFTGFK